MGKLSQDFNLIREDGSWIHFEFQSTDEGVNGLKRFRTYEALARLAEVLLNAGQTETLRRVLEEKDYRKKLLKQYGIE